MDNDLKKQLESVFTSMPEVKLVYLFGSSASGNKGPLSDYDFGVYLDGKDRKQMSEAKLFLMDAIGHLLKTDKVDVVILNMTESPELKYNIVKEGELIYENGPFKLIAEPRVLNDYFDFRALLLRHNLTNP